MTTEAAKIIARYDHEAKFRYSQAVRAGAVERGELPSLKLAALERAGELFQAGRWAESRRVLELNFFDQE